MKTIFRRCAAASDYLAAAICVLALMGWSAASARGAIAAVITQGYPQASPDTVPPGVDTTLNYTVTVSGLNPNEAVQQQITGQFCQFKPGDPNTAVNDGTPGAVATINDGSPTCATFTLSIPAESKFGGVHDVAFLDGFLRLADGEDVTITAGKPAPTDTFDVRSHVVNVTGDPYCIIPASPADDYQSGTTKSTYTAQANFGLDPISDYHWTASANVSLGYAATYLGTTDAEGAPSPGDGDVKCTVLAFGTDAPYSGDLPVTVDDQFVYNFPTAAQAVIATGGTNGVATQLVNVQFSKTLSVGTVEKGAVDFNVSGGATAISPVEQADASAALGLTLGVQYSTGTSETYTAGANNESGWLYIGPELSAQAGTVVESTPGGGPQPSSTTYKFAPLSSGAPSAVFTGGRGGTGAPLDGYTDPKEPGLFSVGS